MCGRFTLTLNPEQIADIFPWVTNSPEISPRYNIAPTQPVAVIPNTGDSRLDFYRWGLIPSWAKDPTIGARLINARAETLTEKPAFRTAFRKRRCLIPADGFFEWQSSAESKSKVPMYIRLKTGNVFAFAGLWETWTAPDGSEIRTCAIITTQPNSLIAPIHNRMPVILPKEMYSRWIETSEVNPIIYTNQLVPYPAEEMEAYPVSKSVNNPQIDTVSLILHI